MNSAAQSSTTTIDHVGLVAADVAALRETYARLGFTVSAATPVTQPDTDGKREISLGLLTAHVAFQATCLELTAVRHPGQGCHLDKWLAKGEGAHVMGLRSGSISRSYSDLLAAGVILPPIRTSSRRITGEGVNGIAQMRWFELPESISREAFTCFVQHDTPELVYSPRLTAHANGALGIRSVFAVVENMDEAFSRYHRLPGTTRRSFAVGRTIIMNEQQIVVVERGGFSAMFPGLDVGQPPHIGGFALTVADLAATRALFAKQGIHFKTWGDKGIWVPPEHTGGAVVAFVDQSAPV